MVSIPVEEENFFLTWMTFSDTIIPVIPLYSGYTFLDKKTLFLLELLGLVAPGNQRAHYVVRCVTELHRIEKQSRNGTQRPYTQTQSET